MLSTKLIKARVENPTRFKRECLGFEFTMENFPYIQKEIW